MRLIFRIPIVINDSNESFPEDIKDTADFTRRVGIPSRAIFCPQKTGRNGDCRMQPGSCGKARIIGITAVNFQKTTADELGITENVSTESGLLEAFEKVKNAGLEVNGGKVTILLANGKAYNGTGWQCGNCVATLANFFGAMPVDENGTYQSLYRTEGFRHAMKF